MVDIQSHRESFFWVLLYLRNILVNPEAAHFLYCQALMLDVCRLFLVPAIYCIVVRTVTLHKIKYLLELACHWALLGMQAVSMYHSSATVKGSILAYSGSKLIDDLIISLDPLVTDQVHSTY
jgi:hypothetical protein